MKNTRVVALYLSFAFLFYVVGGAKVTLTNRCQYTIWPATLTGDRKPQLSTTGFQLAPGASNSVDLPSPWSGRFWARTGRSKIYGGFSFAIGNCATCQVECNGFSEAPATTLVQMTVPSNGGQDFYDVSNVDGFNVPVSVTPQGRSGDCKTSSCPKNINDVCPAKLRVRGSDCSVIACKSACVAFNLPQYCCTGDQYNTPDKCSPTNYSRIFENQCPDAHSYAFDNKGSTCSAGPDYVITFCP